ncbi:glyoxal oxidase N-terminus-domain-containing protein [Mycena alexandri]|uniref:Glyoxal oxidase N-terminus-domain-containing protein n=1 Tax=Mycena alexandri TaxID=1745969 RepID=A0AAD6WZX3_9AGAR|nr:glyoxal oxidase N-terminus-domain-containing protein [Mycena alexandri]
MFHLLVSLASLAHCAWSSDVSSPDPPSTFASGAWSLVQQGTSGVSGMQLAIVTETTAVIFDKVEHNPLMTEDGNPAWTAELNLNTHVVRPLHALSNTWCATGSFLGNGTLLSSGGNPIVITGQDGLQALRFFTPCQDGTCDIWENSSVVRTTSPRWYPASVRIEDGSVIIFGGATANGWMNNATANNPSYEFYPPKNINGEFIVLKFPILFVSADYDEGFNGLKIPSPFLASTLNANLFPIVIELPDGNLFVAANQKAMIFNWKKNTETPLPGIPNGVRVSLGSPATAYTGEQLHARSDDMRWNYNLRHRRSIDFEFSISCFGSMLAATPYPAHIQHKYMNFIIIIIAAGWKVEQMPQARVMPDMVLLPDGRIVIVNGAQTGFGAYAIAPDALGPISNADHPAFTPVVYDPIGAAGRRFSSQGIPASTIPRLYHSTATLTPNGSILLAGSNPNVDITIGTKYQTEYRRYYSPSYLSKARPSYKGLPATVNYNSKFTLSVQLPPDTTGVTVALMDLGFATHGVHMDQRFVKLVSKLSPDKKTLTVTGPPTSRIYPPGPAFLYVVTTGGVPSFGHKTIVGTGASPPVDHGAIDNMLQMAEW